MRKLTLALSTAALAISGAAVAQAAPAPVRGPMPDMTRAQVQARAEAAFARMDANKDGTLDQADRAAHHAMMFDRIDSDKNGSISRAEFDAMHAKRGDKAGGHRMARKGPGGHHGLMAGRMGARDGKAAQPTTRQAFVDRALAMFDRADANRDGTVTQAERKAVRDTLRQQWQAKRQQG